MSRLATGIFGCIALSLSFGAAQLASGRDLSGALQARLQNALADALPLSGIAINRAAKADRVAGVSGAPSQTRTVSLRLHGLAATSFLVRMPVANGASAPAKSGDRKMTVACEPVVSALTEIAKQLQPGRCVT